MLANSLLDHASQIFLVGEVGLAAVYALGMEISRVERCESLDDQKSDYNQVKNFFIKLFERAAERNVNVIPPTDFVVSQHFDPKRQAFQAKTQASSGADLHKVDSEAEA